MRDITTPAPKPNRSAGRLPLKLHQQIASQFQAAWKAPHTEHAKTQHQKSHTKQRTLEAFLNRCIDVLLTHAPAHLDTDQPDLRCVEHPRAWILRHKGQHVFGDRRRTILQLYLNKTKDEFSQSKSQGLTRRIDSEQFDEVHRLAWERGSTQPYLTTFALGLLTDTQNTFFTYPDKPIAKCGRCGADGGATAAHFLQCPLTEPGRELRKQKVCAAFRQGAGKSNLTDDEIFDTLLNVTIQPKEPNEPITTIFPLEGKSPSGLPTALCLECGKTVTLKASDGKPYSHNCIPPEQPATENSQPESSNKRKQPCPDCGTEYTLTKHGVIRQHTCDSQYKRFKQAPQRPKNQKPAAVNPSDTPPRQQRQRKANTRYSQEPQTPPTNPKQASQKRPSQASQEPESQQTAKKGKPKQNHTPASQKRNSQPSQVSNSQKKPKKGKPSNSTQDSDNSDDDEHVEAPSPSPPPPASSESPADAKTDEEVPSHAYHRKQNAQAIASFLGIFNAVATALLITAIPNPLTRRATIKRIRTILLESAYASWWKHWQHILNLETKPATVNLRKRHKYTDNALHKKPSKQRRKHSESPCRTHAKKRKPPDETNPTPDALGSAHQHRTPAAPRVVAASL